jgi:hypothetical protein
MRGEELPADLGRFDLVTFAQSSRWMERLDVATIVRKMLRPGGAPVYISMPRRGDPSVDALPRPRPPWEEITVLVRSIAFDVWRRARLTLNPETRLFDVTPRVSRFLCVRV